MLKYITQLRDYANFDFIDAVFNRIGFSSIAAATGVTGAKVVGETEPAIASFLSTSYLDEIAIIVSIVGGLLFIIEKILAIYIRTQDIKKQKTVAFSDKKDHELRRKNRT